MTPLTPDDFRARLDEASTGAPPTPTPGAGPALVAGRRLLRRRRVVTALGGAAAAAALVATGVLTGALPGSGDVPDTVVASDRGPVDLPILTDAELLRACRDGNQSRAATVAVFGAGTPRVMAVERTSRQVRVALQAADDSHWASCFVNPGEQEFAAGMTVFTTRDPGAGGSSSYGTAVGCPLSDGETDPTCPTWALDVVDRLPAAVAAVRFDIAGGVTEVVPSRDGYVVLNYLGPLPAGVGSSQSESFRPLRRMTYLDAAGTPLAAAALDGSGSGPDGRRVDGLPDLSAYPSLRDDTEIG